MLNLFGEERHTGRIEFAHIVPTPYLQELTVTNRIHLVLAHLVEQDPKYREFYLNEDKFKIMDNSAFEMFKQGKPMLESRKLIDLAQACHAHMIVMSDYPQEDSYKTIKAAKEMAPEIKDAGYQTFFCPQSFPYGIDDLLRSVDWALQNDQIDRIGISILNCPVAFGVHEQNHDAQTFDPAYRLQRFMSRWGIFNEFDRRGWLKDSTSKKRFHCLGMTEGPKEILLLKPFAPLIASWDSSAAAWAGVNDVLFDFSPTGLWKGKLDLEVDFDYNGATKAQLLKALANIDVINEYLREVENAYRSDGNKGIWQGHRCADC